MAMHVCQISLVDSALFIPGVLILWVTEITYLMLKKGDYSTRQNFDLDYTKRVDPIELSPAV